MNLTGKVAIVTGGGAGLGKAIAARLANNGAEVVVADIANADAVSSELCLKGGKAISSDVDVSREESVEAMVNRTLQEFGRIDILVNNAAISAAIQLKPFEELTLDEWQRVWSVNTIGTFLCARAVSPHLRQQRSGRIINMTSGTAFRGAPNMLHYVASKGAIISMTRAMARELGPDFVTVNAIAPGFTLNEGILANKQVLDAFRAPAIASRALPRDCYSEDIVGAVAFLASEDAAFITGQILAVDGGAIYH